MLGRCEAAGAAVSGHTRVTGLLRELDGFTVQTDRGLIRARDVLVATNGYTGRELPWYRTRLAPVDAYMVATAPVPSELLDRLLPADRTYADNRRSANYMVRSSDGRLLFGGRTGRRLASLRHLAADLHCQLSDLLPDLAGIPFTHAWTGRCAATQDMFPHVGQRDGVHYAMGYCFSGYAMAPYLGVKAARRIMARPGAETFYRKDNLKRMSWVGRSPRMLAMLTTYYEWSDQRSQR